MIMPISDDEFVSKILQATEERRIAWEPTANPSYISASFGGKWTIGVLAQNSTLKLLDAEGQQLLAIQDTRVNRIFDLAKRQVLKVDEAIAGLLSELEKPQN